MKRVCIIILAAASCAFAQDSVKPDVIYQTAGPVGPGVPGVMTWASNKAPGAVVLGAPFSATITNESVQTLADGNRIAQTNTGTTARDSQGRTRQDAPLPLPPVIGDLLAANAPHLVFLVDPVAQASYILDVTGKTAQKMPFLPGPPPGFPATPGPNVTIRVNGGGPIPPGPLPLPAISMATAIGIADQGPARTENLGSQTMEGVFVTGVRTTRTLPAGQIGNDKPIDIVTEVWTSPDLKTVVYSRRNDPRIGEQTFRLTNIVIGDPDPSLFTIPAGFKITDGPQPIVFGPNQ